MSATATPLLDEIIAALSAEPRVMLATIIAARGSTPAAALSKLLLRNAGASPVGTIGGGCMEGEVINRARRLLPSGTAEVATYELNEDDAGQGLICGGTIDVLLEPLSLADLPMYRDLRSLYERGDDCVTATVIDGDGRVMLRTITHPGPAGLPVRWTPPEDLLRAFPSLPAGIAQKVESVYRKKESAHIPVVGGTLILEPWTAAPRLVLYGGGHVSKALAPLAAGVGFRVTVADDREKYANRERFPDAAETRVIDFQDAVASVGITDATFVVIVTRGHAFDESVLEQVLRTPARYIGMIGSKRKVLTTFERLRSRGVSVDTLRRVHAPVGVEIGAVTTEEIAVSIVGQLIHIRRGGRSTLHYKSDDIRILLQDLEPHKLIASK